MPTAYSILPDRFADDRHGAIVRGMQRLGYRIVQGRGPAGDPRDVLLTWTRHRGYREDTARAFEVSGGRVVVFEEPHFKGRVRGEKLFSACLHDHNGAGAWTVGGPERWESFGIELKPWREAGRRIVVREQRGIGSRRMASPPGWHEGVIAELRRRTDRPIVVRYHPKSRAYPDAAKAQGPLGPMLEKCHALVTWASHDATAALIEGVPIFVLGPHHFMDQVASRSLESIEAPRMPERLPAFRRLAWAQWSLREFENGTAFEALLHGQV